MQVNSFQSYHFRTISPNTIFWGPTISWLHSLHSYHGRRIVYVNRVHHCRDWLKIIEKANFKMRCTKRNTIPVHFYNIIHPHFCIVEHLWCQFSDISDGYRPFHKSFVVKIQSYSAIHQSFTAPRSVGMYCQNGFQENTTNWSFTYGTYVFHRIISYYFWHLGVILIA